MKCVAVLCARGESTMLQLCAYMKVRDNGEAACAYTCTCCFCICSY